MKTLSPLIKVISKCPKPEAEFEQLIKQLFINDGLINGYTFEKELKHEYGGNDGFVEKNYPEIDLYLTYKNNKFRLGRFTNKMTSEYKRNNNPDVYIILFLTPILAVSNFNKVKKLKEVLYHEFLHFKQYLLNDRQNHNKKLPSKLKPDFCIKDYLKR